MKRIIITKNIFLVKNLFYIYKKRISYYFVLNDKHYRIYNYTIEDDDGNLVEKSKYKYIRFITTPKFEQDSDYLQSIRLMTGEEEQPYSTIFYRNEVLDDICVTKYCTQKVLNFLEKSKIKPIYEIKNRQGFS